MMLIRRRPLPEEGLSELSCLCEMGSQMRMVAYEGDWLRLVCSGLRMLAVDL